MSCTGVSVCTYCSVKYKMIFYPLFFQMSLHISYKCSWRLFLQRMNRNDGCCRQVLSLSPANCLHVPVCLCMHACLLEKCVMLCMYVNKYLYLHVINKISVCCVCAALQCVYHLCAQICASIHLLLVQWRYAAYQLDSVRFLCLSQI